MWPENFECARLFLDLRTQWRMVAGFGGAYWLGLDYAAVEALFRIRHVPARKRAALLGDLQVMELAFKGKVNERSQS